MSGQQTVILGTTNEDLSECVWWASAGDDITEQTLFLYRKESGIDCLLDRFLISPESVPSFEDFQIEVKQQFGGGVYKATIRKPNGQLVKNMSFALAGLPKRTEQQAEPVAPIQQESGLEKVLAVIVQQNQQMQQSFLAGLQAINQNIAAIVQKPVEDPLIMVERVANVLGKTGATPQPQKTIMEQMLEFKQVKDLFAEEVVSSGGDSWGSLAAALVPLTEMMKENTVNERLKLEIAAGQQKAKQQQQQTQVAQVDQASAAKKQEFLSNLKSVLGQIVNYVEQGADASAVAQGLLNIVPDKKALYDFLNREEALADMAKLEPKVDTHWDWFAELANAVLQLIEQSKNENAASPVPTPPNAAEPKAVDSQRGTGDTPNHTANGATSPKRTRKLVSASNGVTTGQAV